VSGTATARHKCVSQEGGQEVIVYKANLTPTPDEIKAQLKKQTLLKQEEWATIIWKYHHFPPIHLIQHPSWQ
jgi:hypothetical protein